MKSLRSVLAVVLVLVMALSMCGCQTNAQRTEALLGQYSILMDESQEQVLALLESIDAYESEIALADLDSLDYVKTLTFNADGTYTYAQDIEGVKACLREFYEGYFDDLYAGRTTLNADYADMGVVFDDMTQDEFRQFYAELYSMADYDTLVIELAENAYDYDALQEPLEEGEFRISGDTIYWQTYGESVETTTEYKLDNGELTIHFSDGTEVYDLVY